MKKFLLVCLGVVIGLLAYGLAAHFGVIPSPGGDKQSIEQIDEATQEPETFTDVNEFLTFVGEIRNIHVIDSILLNAPSEQIVNVAHVCIKKYGKIDRATFFKEYLQNDTYQYLPTQQQRQEYMQQEATPADNQGGTQAAVRPDTLASVAITKEVNTKIE